MIQQQHTQEPWAVGEYWSSSRPHTKVMVLSTGADQITMDGSHRSFIRWVCKSEQMAELEKQRDELLEVFQLVIAEMEHRDRNDGNAPGHGHDIPGVWDSDNGDLAGKPCAWCAVWKKAKELCAAIGSVKGGAA